MKLCLNPFVNKARKKALKESEIKRLNEKALEIKNSIQEFNQEFLEKEKNNKAYIEILTKSGKIYRTETFSAVVTNPTEYDYDVWERSTAKELAQEQLRLFFKYETSTILTNEGGHILKESVEMLTIKEIKE